MNECIEHKDCDFGCGACNWHEAVEFERNRIIGLLSGIAKDCDEGVCNCLSAESTIQLIKGATNAASQD
jgi:hypothetical protein